MSILNHTPVETYLCEGIPVLVKREDMATNPPAPPFSKMRGLYAHLKKLKEYGIQTVGYTETSISMAGWGVAYVCRLLDMTPVLYDPQYHETPDLLKFHRRQWAQFKPIIYPIKACWAKVGYYTARNHFYGHYPTNSIMLELGIPLDETIKETAAEWIKTMSQTESPGTTIVNVGSGTICAGILRGWKHGDGKVIGVLGRASDCALKINVIRKKAKREVNGMLGIPFELKDDGWEYTEKTDIHTPFPCHPYYDKKAWYWLTKNIEELEQPILFWNIGRI